MPSPTGSLFYAWPAAGCHVRTQAFSQACAVFSPFYGVNECYGDVTTVIRATMRTMCRTAGCAVAVVGLTLMIAAAQNETAFAKFKSEMMPKVGQKITVVGTLHDGKQGFWLAFNNWGAYIYATNESGTARGNSLYAQFRSGQKVKVNGTLRHFAEAPATKKEEQHLRSVQRPPEHFFFDAAEIEMSVDTQGH
jgi:hypothetical protein